MGRTTPVHNLEIQDEYSEDFYAQWVDLIETVDENAVLVADESEIQTKGNQASGTIVGVDPTSGKVFASDGSTTELGVGSESSPLSEEHIQELNIHSAIKAPDIGSIDTVQFADDVELNNNDVSGVRTLEVEEGLHLPEV